MSAIVATVVAATAVVAVTQPATVLADEQLPAWCTSTGELQADDLPSTIPADSGCDLTGRLVRDGDAVLAVQPAGLGVAIDGVGRTHLDLSLATLPDGSIVIGHDAEGSGPGLFPPGVHNPLDPDPCAPETASAYKLNGWKRYSSYSWYYNGSGAPADVASDALVTFSQAGDAMADGEDSCDIGGIPRDAYHTWTANTSSAPAATATSCGANDGRNVIGWGSLGTNGTLAVTCTWYQTDVSPWRALASDMKYNTKYSWTTDVLTCAGAIDIGAYDLESVAVHEFGHAFGLGHVAEAGATSSQTMSTNIDGTCQDNEVTLGRGDLNGMFALYGILY